MSFVKKFIKAFKTIFSPPKIKSSTKKSKRLTAKKTIKRISSVKSKKKTRSKKSLKVIKSKVIPPKTKASEGVLIGEITHYFSKIQVVVIKMRGTLKVGDQIQIKGEKSSFSQKVKSLQIESVDVKSAKKGDLVGLKVEKVSKEGDRVYLL